MRRVLVVEDDRLVYDAIQTAFELNGGFDVDYARDGEAALAALSAGNIDLALIDVGLPKVPGLTLAKHALTHHIPFILMSGYAEEIEKLERDQFPILAKPFRVVELIERFEHVVAEAKRLNEMLRLQIEALVAERAERAETPAASIADEWRRICERMRLER